MLPEKFKVFNSVQNLDEKDYEIKGNTKDDVLKELKMLLKNYIPLCIKEPYDKNSESNDGFIELCKENDRVYLVENTNPYTDSYDLQEDGKIIELKNFKEIVENIAELTVKKNLEKKEIIDWLNE